MLYTTEYISTAIGMQSLIGVHGDAPHSWGNYFWLGDRKGPRVANFWSENLTAADRQFNLGGQVKIRRYRTERGDYCLIDDERIPQNWYYQKLCFTGTYPPPIEVLTDMYAHVGDPGNELEQYTNPEKYWTDRGGSYRNGIVTMPVLATPKTLTVSYKCEMKQDEGYYYAPYIPRTTGPTFTK